MKIANLINCTGKFCYRHGNFQNSEAATRGVLKSFIKFIGKHLWQSLYLNKAAVLKPATLLKRRLWHRCFPVNFVKFLSTTFYNCFTNYESLYIIAAIHSCLIQNRSENVRSNNQRCSVKKGVLRNFAKFTGKNPCQRLFLIKLQALGIIKKESLAQVFSWEFWEISKNTFFIEHFWTTASEMFGKYPGAQLHWISTLKLQVP